MDLIITGGIIIGAEKSLWQEDVDLERSACLALSHPRRINRSNPIDDTQAQIFRHWSVMYFGSDLK